LSEADLVHILKDCKAKAVIAWGGFQDTIFEVCKELEQPLEFIFLGELKPAGSHSLVQLVSQSTSMESPAECSSDDVAAILYTAGTTGPPMGVELTHTNLISSAKMCKDMFLLNSEDRLMAVLPLFHPFGQTAIMNTALFSNATMVMHHRFDPQEVLRSINTNKVTFFPAVPSMLKTMLDSAQESDDLSSLKYCITYGFPLNKDIQQRFEDKFNVLVLEGYGLTEATSLVACNRLDRERKPGSVGLPLVGLEINILNENGEALLPGQTGEIAVKGPNVMKGYLNCPKENQQTLRHGWLYTGDIGTVDEDHYFYVTDRKKDIIVKGGFHIYPKELENIALQHPKISEAVAVGVTDPVQGEEVKLHIILKENEEATEEEIRNFCKEHLEVYKCPKFIQFHTSFPKTTTGRILKRELREQGLQKNINK
jgi:long-chain acyl-CoA synthetase